MNLLDLLRNSSGAEFLHIIAAFGSIIASTGSICAVLLGLSHRRRVEELRIAVNGRLTQLLKNANKLAKAERKLETLVKDANRNK